MNIESEQPKRELLIGRVALAKGICFDWVFANRKIVFILIGSLIVTTFSLYQFSSKINPTKKPSYMNFDTAFQKWMTNQTHDLKVFQQIEKPLKAHPQLQAKFGTAVAQRLFGFGDMKRGSEYANAAMKRGQNLNTSYYSQFSKNTLLVTAGKYDQALTAAEQLKENMIKDVNFWDSRDPFIRSGSVLYAYNLLRIAALHRQLGSKEKELLAWKELEANAGWDGALTHSKAYDPEAYALLAQSFVQGELSLFDYIQERKRECLKH